MRQSTNHIFLVRPANFGYNTETAESNAFQHKLKLKEEEVKQKAIEEFDAYVALLQKEHIDVQVILDTPLPIKPDAIFPNNWGSFHSNGTVVLYPMEAPNRRAEKRVAIIDSIKSNYIVNTIIDLSDYELEGKFCEGTGSIIFDHVNKIAYAGISSRTDKHVFNDVCNKLNYEAVSFTATDENNKEIYHTNVMMNISDKFSVICLESIKDLNERNLIINKLESTKHEIIDISLNQAKQFAGNMLSVLNRFDEEYLIMSKSAYNALNQIQKNTILKYCKMLPVDLNTIETVGGGSARCMISEIFLEKKLTPVLS